MDFLIAMLLLAASVVMPFKTLDQVQKLPGTDTITCSGAISGAGELSLFSDKKSWIVYLDPAKTKFVAAYWPEEFSGMPAQLFFGDVKAGKLVIKKSRAFDPLQDSLGPCPAILPQVS